MIYVALKNLRLRDSEDVIFAGTYFCDEADYDPDGGIQEISTGERVPGSSARPQPILYRAGFWANTEQSTKNLLIGHVVDIVDAHHPDYGKLVEFGVIQQKKTKSAKKADETEKDNE